MRLRTEAFDLAVMAVILCLSHTGRSLLYGVG